MTIRDSLSERISTYKNTAEHNDSIYSDFSKLVLEFPLLVDHRQYIERNSLGFGDIAFHYMWYLIVIHLLGHTTCPKILEIGVFKGQTISLFALLSSNLNLDLSIAAISPLRGNPLPKSVWERRIKKIISFKFRQEIQSGNFYPDDDYLEIIKQLFIHFDLEFSKVRMIQGFSNEKHVLESIGEEKFSLIYIDGDHTYEGVKSDINNYGHRVEKNGFLVMDDANYYNPGSSFWKGYEVVAKACDILPSLGFVNVLNVGHNRIYQKVF
ncbi:class I SAM-dependent methyltransferase [Pseudanabaena sp. FACHB-1998]|uniref:class I SAM-dependent methyltransferase n=1 Tax=Pseudanabaena sp. FACHB-1998 TaxID=2692858 RepID=UPI0016816EAE|nr:class I SAM-dependent methyltransferase [Pseudanabaena sp. FACHB-1998]MBD2176619.1 class I SAM-dependent methyltransferase [Pseudanabaena sp. FACHB-1998]